MTETIRMVASRIRELREISGVTVPSLAAEMNVAPDTLRGYESGETDIPISFLYGFAARFGVELVALLTGEEPRLHLCQLVRKGKGVSVERRSDYAYQSLAYNFAHKRAEPFLVTVDPKGLDEPVPLNTHDGQEFTYVLEGRVMVLVDALENILNEGDSLYFDANLPHGMKALGGKPATFLAVVV
ncbi:MAG: XRE family transcriptional regulator [bacterium]|nr:XRE family transcriptional regulator [bacterium]MDT8396782.1 XRE family transcriptional regulator [bacterium]